MLLALIGLWSVAAAAPLAAQRTGGAELLNSASWWIESYGLMDPSDPLARRADEVFLRVSAAADKRSNRMPRLVLLRRPDHPLAIALPDGSVTITRSALELCYREGRDKTGDAKLAFVLGHELSHLASDDFWHRAAFAFVRDHASKERRRELDGILVEPSDQTARELRADAHGVIYAALAGYEPRALVARGSFIADWVSRLSAAGYAASQLSSNQRIEVLRSQLLAVAEEVDIFNFGVRLVQLGRYADALVLLERFRAQFPGREVLNNIGVAHLQLALRFLAGCDTAQYLRFKLPLVVDPGTFAGRMARGWSVPLVRSAGTPTLSCSTAARFRGPLMEAVRNLRLAKERDPAYVPACENLITALLVAGNGTEALSEANAALRLDPANSALALQRAVALYMTGSENDVDTASAAVASLRQLQKANPASAAIAYDLARILTERERLAAAGEEWRRFLMLEPAGSYAAEAQRWLPDGPPSAATGGPTLPEMKLPTSPLPLGRATADLINADTLVRSIREGTFRGTILQKGKVRALSIDDVVEVVEVPTEATGSPLGLYGPPTRTERGLPGGRDLYFYPGLMVEWAAGRSRTEVFFEATPSADRPDSVNPARN